MKRSKIIVTRQYLHWYNNPGYLLLLINASTDCCAALIMTILDGGQKFEMHPNKSNDNLLYIDGMICTTQHAVNFI